MSDGPDVIAVLVVLVLYLVVFGIPIMQIVKKAGYSRAWVLVFFIPVVNLVFLWIFAFSRWPVEATRA